MSILKDLADSNDGVKSLSMNIIMIPFWYIAIYLFHPIFFKSNDFILVISFCISLSIVSYILLGIAIHNFSDNDGHLFNTMGAALNVFLQTCWLALLILVCYGWSQIFDNIILFFPFILIYYALIFTLFVMSLIEEKHRNKEKKQ